PPPYRPFFQRTKAGRSLTRVEDTGRITLSGLAEPSRQGGDAGQSLKKIEQYAFCHQEGTRLAFHDQHNGLILGLTSVGGGTDDFDRRIDLSTHFARHRHTDDDERLVCHDRSSRAEWIGKQRGSR